MKSGLKVDLSHRKRRTEMFNVFRFVVYGIALGIFILALIHDNMIMMAIVMFFVGYVAGKHERG